MRPTPSAERESALRRYLTIEDTAQRYHTTQDAIYRRRSRGDLPPAFKTGTRVLWLESDLDAFDDAHRESPRETA